MHERVIVNFQALDDQTNPSGGSHRRLLERAIINFQALTDRAKHWGNWLKDIRFLMYEPASDWTTRAKRLPSRMHV